MCPCNEIEEKETENVPHMQAVDSILFAAQINRPDRGYAVNLLSRFSTNPGKTHWDTVKRVKRYLKGTMDKGITHQCGQGDKNLLR